MALILDNSYFDVTEISGEEISVEQLQRLHHRYFWARNFSKGLDVVEVGCGSGSGLELISNVATSLVAGDYDQEIIKIANKNNNSKFKIEKYDALNMPYANNSKDVIIIFEAIYYLKSLKLFIKECNRVLKKNGKILISTANKDLFDFSPSPKSVKYYGVLELNQNLSKTGKVDFYGYLSTKDISLKQKIFRPLKQIITSLGLYPKTMKNKKFFKKIIFGKLIRMPKKLIGNEFEYIEPSKIKNNEPDKLHKVIYCIYQKI